MAEVGPPHVVVSLRVSRTKAFSPDDGVGRVDAAVPVVVADDDDAGHLQIGNANLVPIDTTSGGAGKICETPSQVVVAAIRDTRVKRYVLRDDEPGKHGLRNV